MPIPVKEERSSSVDCPTRNPAVEPFIRPDHPLEYGADHHVDCSMPSSATRPTTRTDPAHPEKGCVLMLRVRLYGLPADNDDAVTELAKVFDVLDDSKNVEPRERRTKLRFRYLTLAFLDAEA